MADLTLSSQDTLATAAKVKTDEVKTSMDDRLAIWRRIPNESRLKWLKSGKDPVLTLAYEQYVYYRDNFFGEMDNGQG